jgi:hypothetical protein
MGHLAGNQAIPPQTTVNPPQPQAAMKILFLFLIMSSILLASRHGALALRRQPAE